MHRSNYKVISRFILVLVNLGIHHIVRIFVILNLGQDVTPDTCLACRENAHHVTADIAFAARQYISATRDIDWLKGRGDGCKFIIDMARFWVSRTKYDRGLDRYHIRGKWKITIACQQSFRFVKLLIV